MIRKPLNVDDCPKSQELEAYAAQQLIGKRNEEIFLHLKFCVKCLRKIASLRRVPSPGEVIQPRRPGWIARWVARWPFRRQ